MRVTYNINNINTLEHTSGKIDYKSGVFVNFIVKHSPLFCKETSEFVKTRKIRTKILETKTTSTEVHSLT